MSDLDTLLTHMAEGLPQIPVKRYELRCHPDVYLALTLAAPPVADPWSRVRAVLPLYGTADVIVDPEMPSGAYRITEDGAVVKEGVLRPA